MAKIDGKLILSHIANHRTVIVTSTILGMVISMVVFKWVPKNYKASSVVSIPTQYFQNPLVRDFLPETYDGSELRAQREGLIRRSLNYQFINDIAKKYQLATSEDEALSSYELNQLSSRFEIVPVAASNFLVAFFHRDPTVSYEVLQDFIRHIRSTLATERRNTLYRLHNSIHSRLQELSLGRQDPGENSALLAARPDLAGEEIARLEAEEKALQEHYSPRHPKVAEIRRRISQLSAWIGANTSAVQTIQEATRSGKLAEGRFASANVDPGSKDLFQDLLKKYHYLKVVISLDESSNESYLSILQEPYVPKTAIWPKRPIFLIWGIAFGFLVGCLISYSLEGIRGRSRGRLVPATLIRPSG